MAIPHRVVYSGGEQDVTTSEAICLTSSKPLSLARDLGYANVRDLIETHRVGSNEDIFRRLLLRDRVSFVYSVVIDPSIPVWLLNLLHDAYIDDPNPFIEDDILDNYDPFLFE
jgi:hypothetical protein